MKQLSPKAKIALKAVILAGMKHKEAAAIAGIHPAYVSTLKNSTEGKAYTGYIENQSDLKDLETNALLSKLGREAVERLAGLMRFSANENIILRASQDLADRSGETQKIQRHQVEAFTLDGKDARGLAEAMVEAARLKEQFSSAIAGDYIRVPLELPSGE